jgi:diketogulonate reductase-like aldo/keto reductase
LTSTTNPFRELPVIGQGTWEMEHTRAESVRSLVAGLEHGLVHVDTAEMYGNGRCEEIVADAIEAWGGGRDNVFLVTKVLPHNASRTGTRRALEQSLRRLRTDHVDGYLLHWRSRIPLEETLDALMELQREGKTRCIGVSNFDEEDIERCVSITGPGVIACNQVLYHLEERAIEHAVIPTCVQHGVAVVAYSPFGSGHFPEGEPTLARIAAAHGASARQVALAFLTRAGVLAIPKAAKQEHVEDNAGALTLELGDDDVRAIDAAFPLGKKPRTLPTI